jgi:hypothetical protein
MYFFSTNTSRAVAQLPSDPRARRTLDLLLEHRPLQRRPRRCADIDPPCQYCWLYWLLRSRQPRLALAVGQIEADWLIVAGSAISADAGGRLLCQADTGNTNPPQSRAHADDLRHDLARAGLEWGIRMLPPTARHQAGSVHALILACSLERWPERLMRLAPALASGALVIGLANQATPAGARETFANLKQACPDFQAMVMDISDRALIVADYRGV